MDCSCHKMKTNLESRAVVCPLWFEQVTLAIVVLVVIEQHSRLPELGFLTFLVSLAVLVVLGAVQLGRFAKIQRRKLLASKFSLKTILSWLAFPCTVAIVLSSSATHWPASVRFQLSRPSFDALVSKAFNGERPRGFPRRVGLYWIESVKDLDFNYSTKQGTIGFVTGACLVDDCGLYFDQSDPKSSHWLTTRIVPQWYLTEW